MSKNCYEIQNLANQRKYDVYAYRFWFYSRNDFVPELLIKTSLYDFLVSKFNQLT